MIEIKYCGMCNKERAPPVERGKQSTEWNDGYRITRKKNYD
jgi:hypothetical protein